MKSILLIGINKFGTILAKRLHDLGHEVLAVDRDEERINAILPLVTDAQIGDSTNEAFLRSLGINNFDVCIVTISSDFQSSLETTSLLKELGGKFVVARADRDVQEKFLLKNGADHIIYPERETAEALAVSECNDSIFDCIPLADGFNVYEITAPAGWLGKTIGNVNVRSKYNISILATIAEGKVSPMPHVDYVFRADEHLMVLGNSESIRRITV